MRTFGQLRRLMDSNRELAQKIGKISTGKDGIRFTKLENLNLEVAMELVKRAAGGCV